MITVGLAKELEHISTILMTPVQIELSSEINPPITIKVDQGWIDIFYLGNHIWREELSGDASFWGVESCDSISRIINLINSGDFKAAQEMFYGIEEKD